jgi:serine/threonine protein kinase/Tol biopolymer transport system component
MQLAPGSRLAHYEVTALLGRGGMGEVWRARDTKLGREVAIKVLPEEFTKDTERLARFEREARVLASLQHSQIATIHGFEESEGLRFLVMQLADGEDLSQRLTRGAIPIDEALAIALGIAEALEAAHEKGIIHRDLKPANVKVDPDGSVMVLDFGLAKALEVEEGDPDLSNSPTMVKAATQAGMILGTAGYMSPEQARGRRVDRRADIWAFGVLLYEMITGERLFAGETVSDTLASVLTREIDLSKLPASTPSHVRWLLDRCLDRDPKRRLRDIGEARICLQDGSEDMSTEQGASISSRPASVASIAAALVIGLVLGLGATWLMRPEPTQRELRKVDIQLAHVNVWNLRPLLSPDGRKVLLPGVDGLLVRRLDEVTPRLLPGTKDMLYMCWSPDSSQIAFSARGRLWIVPIDGRSPVPVANLPQDLMGAGGMTWLEDDRIVLAGSATVGLIAVPARGGTPKEIVALDKSVERDLHEVSELPDGRGLLVSLHLEGKVANQIDLVVGGERRKLLTFEHGWVEGPVYSSTGHILFASGEATPEVWAVPFSLDRLEVTGEPFLIAAGAAYPSVASDGTLAYVRGNRRTPRQLLEVDRSGRIKRELSRPLFDARVPDVTSDGRRIAVSVRDGVTFDVVVLDAENRTATRVLSDPVVEIGANWSPDNSEILYEIGDRDLLQVLDVARGGEPQQITEGNLGRWFPDGRSVAMIRLGDDGTWDLWRHWIEDGRDDVLLKTGANENWACPRPVGGLVAYLSDETGRDEVYVFDPDRPGSKVQVSFDGATATDIKWSFDGRELFYQQDDALMVARLREGDRALFDTPARLFSLREAGFSESDGSWTVMPDGGFVVMRDISTGEGDAVLTLVSNWDVEFE